MHLGSHSQFLVACVFSLIAFDTTANAQPPAQVPTVRVSARAALHASPDQAEVDLGFVTRAETSQLSSRNAKQLESILNEVRRSLGPAGDVRTVGYSVRPDYNRFHDKGEPAISDTRPRISCE
jgi:uncharacterized protein YggE